MLLTNNVNVMITVRNAKYYKDKGYDIPMRRDSKSNSFKIEYGSVISVSLNDIAKNSRSILEYECDNCHNVFKSTVMDWNHRKHLDKGTYCKDCATKVLLPSCIQEKYGVANSSSIPEAKEKRKATNMERYGVEYAITSKQVRDKIVASCLEKYGVDNPMKNDDIKMKAQRTNIERYGGTSALCDPLVREKSRNTNMKKYGVPVSSQSKEVQSKARMTLYKNGNIPTSKAESEMCAILEDMFGKDNCCRGYPEENLSLDCLVKIGEYKIDFEYDGLYWHKGRESKDRARNAVLMNLGYKIVRVQGNNIDDMPTREQIQSAVDYLIKENHHLVFINMNN